MPRSRSRSPVQRAAHSRRDDRRQGSRRDEGRYRERRRSDSPPPRRDDRPRERKRSREREPRARDSPRGGRGYDSPRGGRGQDSSRGGRGDFDRRPLPRDVEVERFGSGSRRSRSRSRSASPKREEPNFGNSGLLAAATNTVKGSDGSSTVLKYNEPPEARKPTRPWRLYVFKGKEDLGLLQIANQSAYLVGRDQLVADIPIDHPSCSKQHAVIQHRQVQVKDDLDRPKMAVKPFIIDLDSTNGTFVNDKAIPTSRYYELIAKDVIKFGQSTREYVLVNEDDLQE